MFLYQMARIGCFSSLNTSKPEVVFLGGTSTKRGGPQLQKNRVWRDLKLQIFGAEGAENFEKFKGFM